MPKPTLQDALARKSQPPEPSPTPAGRPATKARPSDGKFTTSLRLEPELLGRLKMLALRRRTRVNDEIVEAIQAHLALHDREAA